MPVDDLLAWAAETAGVKHAESEVEQEAADERQTCLEFRSVAGRSPSPAPLRKQLPKWYDVGHCAAACSNRCSLHAAQPDRQNASPGDVVQKQRRHHGRSGRPKFRDEDSQEAQGGTISQSKTSESRKSRLDRAREELLMGNVQVARQIVAEELERLTDTASK